MLPEKEDRIVITAVLSYGTQNAFQQSEQTSTIWLPRGPDSASLQIDESCSAIGNAVNQQRASN